MTDQTPFYVAQQPQQQVQQASMWSGLTPQQKMALVLAQGQNQQKVDQRGTYGTANGLAEIGQKILMAQMMQSQAPQQPQQPYQGATAPAANPMQRDPASMQGQQPNGQQ